MPSSPATGRPYSTSSRRSGGRRLEALVASEGFGWLLPRYAAPPWEQVARQAWQVADEADLRWMLPRLRPTPFGHFTSPVALANPAAGQLPRTYIRCRGFPHPGFDRYAQTASQDPAGAFST
jgi:hypothetical protein